MNPKKTWKDMTFDEKVSYKKAQTAHLADPETKHTINTLNAFYEETRKRKEKMNKLRSFLLEKRGLQPT